MNPVANVNSARQPPSMASVSGTSQWRTVEEEDEAQAPAFKALTREEAQALREKDPPLNPWRVIVVQMGVGTVAALLAAMVTGRQEVGWSLLYGAFTVVVPGALMARGMTSRLSSVSPGASAVSFMLWEMVKMFKRLKRQTEKKSKRKQKVKQNQ